MLSLHHGRAFVDVPSLFSLIGIVGLIMNCYRRNLVTEASLELTESGFAGTIERKSITIRWSDIAGVRDLDRALVITVSSKNGRLGIAIPKAAIADVGALWATLEDRLIAKRGLIRPSVARRHIVNTAYPVGAR